MLYYLYADQYLQIGHSISRSNVSTDPSYYQRALLIGPLIIFVLGIVSLIILNFTFLFRQVQKQSDEVLRIFIIDPLFLILDSSSNTFISVGAVAGVANAFLLSIQKSMQKI